MLLVYLTIAVAVLIVLVLAGYLLAIAWALMHARRNVAELATTLEAIAEATGTLPRAVEGVDDAVAAIAEAVPTDESASVEIAKPVDRRVPESED